MSEWTAYPHNGKLTEVGDQMGLPPKAWESMQKLGIHVVEAHWRDCASKLAKALEKSKARIEFMAKEPYNFESDQTLQAIDLALEEFNKLKGGEKI